MAAQRAASDHCTDPDQPSVGFERISGSLEQTQAFGEQLGQTLQPGDVVALYGVLGSGKTTLVQGIARGMGLEAARVKSPTFVLLREYHGSVPLVHVDGYRLDGASAVSWLDLDQLFSPRKVTAIEWAERCEGVLPEDHLEVRLRHVSANRRHIALVPHGTRAQELVRVLHDSPGTSQTTVQEQG